MQPSPASLPASGPLPADPEEAGRLLLRTEAERTALYFETKDKQDALIAYIEKLPLE